MIITGKVALLQRENRDGFKTVQIPALKYIVLELKEHMHALQHTGSRLPTHTSTLFRKGCLSSV